MQATLYANHTSAGGATVVLDQRGNIPLPASGISVAGLSVRVFVDRSVIEVRYAFSSLHTPIPATVVGHLLIALQVLGTQGPECPPP